MRYIHTPKNRGLLIALVLLILLQPVVPGAWILFLYLVAMAVAVWMLVGAHAVVRAALTLLAASCLVLLPIVQGGSGDSGPNRWNYSELVVAVAIVLFLLYACLILFRALLQARSVDGETILGAINLYIVFGLMWSLLYAIHEWALPGSLHFSTSSDTGAVSSLATFTYFSFVTQATQGYGDIVPLHPFARSLVILHTIAGQFYLAIVIAYFLGLYIARNEKQSSD